jgi:succinate dehydrogenase hydrophobic anchor subunit
MILWCMRQISGFIVLFLMMCILWLRPTSVLTWDIIMEFWEKPFVFTCLMYVCISWISSKP